MLYESKQFDTIVAQYRPDTSDLFVLKEVITNRIYRRKKIGFDVEKGERWLDLGANIGAFALYCKIRGARAVCYEPDPACFKILQQNVPEFPMWQKAVTAHRATTIPFWKGRLQSNHSKATSIPSANLPRHPNGTLPNIYAGSLIHLHFDGIKMDIEGSEGELIDQWLLPRCNKLVMEYHSSRDKSVENLRRRIETLRSRFEVVSYPPEYDRIIAVGINESYEGNQLTYFDRMIFCKGAKA